jgi:hypothetical protein
MEGIADDVHEVTRGRDVVSETTHRGRVTCQVILLPLSKEVYEEVSAELLGKDLGEEVEVAHECCLENDGDVRGVEELDGVWLLVALHLAGRKNDLNAEAL